MLRLSSLGVGHGFVVVEGLLPPEAVRDLKARCDRIMAHEREHPFDSGDGLGAAAAAALA